MVVLDFVLNWHFGVGLIVGWKVLPYLIDFAKSDFGKKFLKK